MKFNEEKKAYVRDIVRDETNVRDAKDESAMHEINISTETEVECIRPKTNSKLSAKLGDCYA